MTDMMEIQWINMYGSRTPPRSALDLLSTRIDESAEESAYLGRLLLNASVEKAGSQEEDVKSVRKPLTQHEVDAVLPRSVG